MRSYVDRVLSAFEVNLIAIIVAVATSCILFLPAQFREIYRTFAQRAVDLATVPNPVADAKFWGVVATSVYTPIGLILLSILIWLACRSNTQQQTGDAVSSVAAMTRRIIGLGLALLPILALALGLYLATISDAGIEEIKELLVSTKTAQLLGGPLDPDVARKAAVEWAAQSVSFNRVLIMLAAGFLVAGVLLGVLLNALENSARANAVGRFMLSGPVALVAAVAFLVLCAVFSDESGAAATHASAVPILFVFAALSLVVVNFLTVRSGSLGRLVAWAFAAAAIVFSLSGLNNNHRVRRVPLPDSAQASPTAPNLSDAFLTWYNARDDRSKYAGRYPIYVVAAQGGGIYAAYQAAAFLSTAQARCPNFAHHLFAISSVSGGSVGASVFAALMKEAELQGAVKIPDLGCNDAQAMAALPDDQTFVDDVRDILAGDFWSPLQAKGLFPDLLQWFMPIWIEKFDRARALEHALEASWRRVRGSDTMAEPFASLWPKGFAQSKLTPALVLNTTEVDSGRRRLIAPFEFKGLVDLKFFHVNCRSGSTGRSSTSSIESVPLSTASVLSARFPWVTPTGWFYERQAPQPPEPPVRPEMDDCTPDKRLVTKLGDGGYFEDSGVASALDLIASLREIARGLPVDIRLIILTSSGFTSLTRSGLDEATDPIRAMLNTRVTRGIIEVGRAERIAGFMQAEPPMKVIVDGLGYPLPLGWSLSDLTNFIILYQVGDIGPCARVRGTSKTAEKVGSGSCNIETLVNQLTYKAPATPTP